MTECAGLEMCCQPLVSRGAPKCCRNPACDIACLVVCLYVCSDWSKRPSQISKGIHNAAEVQLDRVEEAAAGEVMKPLHTL